MDRIAGTGEPVVLEHEGALPVVRVPDRSGRVGDREQDPVVTDDIVRGGARRAWRCRPSVWSPDNATKSWSHESSIVVLSMRGPSWT